MSAEDAGTVSVHKPFPDDGVMYCGWDGHEGCGEIWPCSTVRATKSMPDTISANAERMLSPEVVVVLDQAYREWRDAGYPAGEAVVHLQQFVPLGWSHPQPTETAGDKWWIGNGPDPFETTFASEPMSENRNEATSTCQRYLCKNRTTAVTGVVSKRSEVWIISTCEEHNPFTNDCEDTHDSD